VALLRTVVSVTGIPLQGHLVTGFDGFQRLIDGLGGMPLKAPVAVNDTLSGAKVRAGATKLTGSQALACGRARHAVAGGDFGRSANQGLMIMAATRLAKAVGPARLPGILRMADANIATYLSAEQVLTFAAGADVTQSTRIHNRLAAGGFGWTADRQAIVLLDANARTLFADMRDGNLS
jgi:polyisoprenyl-teichoic acid--peptidoglycan teichoic acid transferase